MLFREGTDIFLCSPEHKDWVSEVDAVAQFLRVGKRDRERWFLGGRRGPRWAPTGTDRIQIHRDQYGIIHQQRVGDAWFVPLPSPHLWAELSIRFLSGDKPLLTTEPGFFDAHIAAEFGRFPDGSTGGTSYAPL